MAYKLKENLMKEERLEGGHRMCAGCGSPIAVRTVLRALNPEDKAVVCSATSCLEVSTFMYPYTAWKDSFIHNAFENADSFLVILLVYAEDDIDLVRSLVDHTNVYVCSCNGVTYSCRRSLRLRHVASDDCDEREVILDRDRVGIDRSADIADDKVAHRL